MHIFILIFLQTMDPIDMTSNVKGNASCELQKPEMEIMPNVIEMMSREHTISCSAPQCVSGVRCRFFREAESEPFRSVSSDSNQCDFTASGGELLGDMDPKSLGYLHFSCDSKNIINSETSGRSDSFEVIVKELVKAEIKIATTEDQKNQSIMIRCEGDRPVKGLCLFYKNEDLLQSETYFTDAKACVILVLKYQLLDPKSVKRVTQVNVSCEIEVIRENDKWISRRSRNVTVDIYGNLGKPALSATSNITGRGAAVTLICELPQTFSEAHCYFYRDDDSQPFKSNSSEDKKCELSVNSHELLENRSTETETEVQLRCDYTLNMSPEIHSQYSSYFSIRVLAMDPIDMTSNVKGNASCELQKPEMEIMPNVIEMMSREHTISCSAPQCVSGVRCRFFRGAESEPFRSVSSDSNQCDFTASGGELLGDMDPKSLGYLHFSCDSKNIINNETSGRSDNFEVIVKELVKAEIKIATTEDQKNQSIMIRCEGDRPVKGLCLFYKNEDLLQSETYFTDAKACVILVLKYQLLDPKSVKRVTQVNVSCEIEVIRENDKWISRRSRNVTVDIYGNLGKPALSATSNITGRGAAVTLICELPQTFSEAHCYFYRDDDSQPFKTNSSEDKKCELSVNSHELLENRSTETETEVQLRCDYTLNMSPEIHSQYSSYFSIRVLGKTACELQKAQMVIMPNVIDMMSREHTISCSAPQCLSGVRCRVYRGAESEPFRSGSSDSNRCDFTARGEELLGDVDLKSEGYLHFSCDSENIISSETSGRSDNLKIIVKEHVKAEINIVTTEDQKNHFVTIKCVGDQPGKGLCHFYKNDTLFRSEAYHTDLRACVIMVFKYLLLDQRSVRNVTQVNVSCEIEVIRKNDKWKSRRSRKVTMKVNGNLGKPALSATSNITGKEAALTLTCEVPQTFPEAHCHFYRDDDSYPFKSKSSEDNKCELSVDRRELLGGRATGMETEVQLRCDYTLNMSPEIHSQYSKYRSVRVLDVPKPQIFFNEGNTTSVLCLASPNVTEVLFNLHQEGREERLQSKKAGKNQNFVTFETERHDGKKSHGYWCQYEYKGIKSPRSDLILTVGEECIDALLIRGTLAGLFFIIVASLHLYAYMKCRKNIRL
ncbi:uncharacterized protein LOC120539517 isoform X1 [Polypterus senegalus]|uniref:uncharacterized protein LOC120539517 isoform X1 n=1 Tax=Polypterus senegalus TaxID=55291 RepID=UPI001965F746|nr:uncharacterized protein LOC120539517 isoform X1 [Polypterus senegalus]